MKERPYARLWCRECDDWNGPFYIEALSVIMGIMKDKKYSGFYRVLATEKDVAFDFRDAA